MSRAIESALLTKVLEEGTIAPLIKQRVNEEFFQDDDCRDVFNWFLDHFNKYGKTPSLKLTRREHPGFRPVDMDDDLEPLIDQVKKEKLYVDLAQFVDEVAKKSREDPYEGMKLFRQRAGDLSLVHSNVEIEDITKTIKSVKREYKKAKKGGGVTGIPWAWPHLTTITGGRQKGEFHAVYGRPKCMKTWVSLYDANFLHETMGMVIGFATCDMLAEQTKRRLASLRARVPYSLVRKGQLDRSQEKDFFRALKDISRSKSFYTWRPDSLGQEAVTDLRVKVEEHGMDLLWVDSFYGIMEEESHKAFRVITRGLKSIASECKIVVCGSTQANRSGEKRRGEDTTEIAFGDSLAQDCDGLLRLVRDQQHREQREILVTLPVMRESASCAFVINAKPSTDFSQKYVETLEDAEFSSQAEDEENGDGLFK